MKINANDILNENTNQTSKEIIINHKNGNHKVKFNLLEYPEKKESTALKREKSVKSSNKNDLSKLKTKLSMKSSIKKDTAIKTEFSMKSTNPKSKKTSNKLKSLFNNPGKIDKTQSFKNLNNNSKKSQLEQTKNNFLKLITEANKDNYVKEYNNKNPRYSLLYDKNHFEVYEGDYLEKAEKTLRNKIIDMEKNVDFMEFEIGPLDISINRFNLKKNKKKLSSERKKSENKKELINSADKDKIMRDENLSTDKNNLMDDNILLNKSNRNFDDSDKKIYFVEKNKLNNNIDFNSKLKLSSTNNQRTNYISEKESNILSNYKKSKKKNYKNRNSKISLYERMASIFKTNDTKNDFSKKDTLYAKNKTYSNIDSKFGTTIRDITESMLWDKEFANIDKEKFRILSHKKLVYDSLDDEELMEEVINENFYLAPNSTLVIIVDSLVLICTFWSIVYKPLYLVLNNCDVQNTITSMTFNNISNIFIDLLFIFDLIINFFKAYYTFEEQLITKAKRIFFHYLKKFFTVDFISAAPYYSIIKFIALKRYNENGIIIKCSEFYNHKINDVFQIIELIKLIKVFKCLSRTNIATNYILKQLYEFTFFDNWSFLIFNTYLFFILLHLTACIHIFISSTTYPNWIITNNLDAKPFSTIYLNSIYFLLATVTSVGYGDIIGNTFTEFCFQIVILLVGIIAYSWLISSISNYIKEINKQNEVLNKKINILNEIKIEHPNMPTELYDKIYLHLEYINLKQKKDKSALMDSLPPSITKSLLYEMYKPIIENFKFFKNFKNSEFINQVISKLKPIIAAKNDLLLDQGELIEETFFVKQGRLSLEVKIDTNYPEKSVQKLLDKDYFFGDENNELYQKNAFAIMNMTTTKRPSFSNTLSQKNLYTLYSRSSLNNNTTNMQTFKSVLVNDQGNEEIKKQNTISNYIYLKILDIRKNEHFGALLMFLNKRSPLSLRVKTKKAELYILMKIDAVEISSSYPNIWKRVNKASFHNLKQIKRIMNKIIKHFCETYGINFMKKICEENNVKDINDLKKLYTVQNKISKNYYKNNFSVINNNHDSDPKRLSALVTKSQLKMLKEFINSNSGKNDNKLSTIKKYKNKNIYHSDIKEFKYESNIHSEKEKNLSMSKKFVSSVGEDSQMNYSLNMIKIKNNDNSPKKDKSLFFFGDKNNLNVKNDINNNKEIKENINNKNSKNKETQKSNKELIKYFGTPFYPEDINDEIYSEESESKNTDDNDKKNIVNNIKNIDELEYIPVNNILSSQGTIKSNYKKTKNENDYKHINTNIINNNNNFFINNNLIANNIINHIRSLILKKDLSVFHFGFNFKSKKDESSYKPKSNKNKDKNKIYNLAIFQNSFELSAFKNKQKINLDLNKILEKEGKIQINSNKISRNNGKSENLSSSSPSCRNGSFCSSCSSCFIGEKYNNNLNKHFTFELPIDKNFQPSTSTFIPNGFPKKEYKIDKTKELKYKSNYFNLNEITNGKIIKNKNFQNYIKSIIIQKFSVLTHSRLDLPIVKNNFNSLNSTSIIPISKIQTSKKYSALLPNHFWHNDKFKNSFTKNRRSIFTIPELYEKNKGKNYSTNKITRINRKNNSNQSHLLSYINKNIKDDSVVLHEPEKFYSGLFNNIMKKYSKANINIFQK